MRAKGADTNVASRREWSAAGRALPAHVGRYNRGLILAHLARDPGMSRSDIAAATDLTRPAVTRIVDQMIHDGLVQERPDEAGYAGRGRPQVGLELRADGGFVLGVGLGAYEQSIRLVNLQGECVGREHFDLADAETVIPTITAAARRLLRTGRVRRDRLLGMTAGIAGVVDHIRGAVIESPNIGWRAVNFASALERRLQIPVFVDALHHVLNVAEARAGRGRPVDSSVLVNIALGIGSSAIEFGKVLRGAHAMAGQIGHLHAPGATELCTCGRYGCLDTVASGYAVLRNLDSVPARRVAREHTREEIDLLLEAIHRERRGDLRTQAVFHDCGAKLGEALCAVLSILDPSRIVLAGPLAQVSSFVEGARTRVRLPHDAAGAHGSSIDLCTYEADEAAAIVALQHFVFPLGMDGFARRP